MTKVVARYTLPAPLAEEQLARLDQMRGVYGILQVDYRDGSTALSVEYDATRLRPPEVGALLRRHGIPAAGG